MDVLSVNASGARSLTPENAYHYSLNSTDVPGNVTSLSWLDNSSFTDNGSEPGSPEQGWLRPPLLKQSPPVVVLFSVAYLIVFVLAVVNNTLVVTVICKNPQMRTVTNYFLANLAVADIMVSFVVLPITLLSNLFHEWLFGELVCKAIPYMQAVVVGAAVNTLAAVAVERFCSIFYPHKTIIPPNTAFIIICLIWLVPICLQIPWAMYYKQVWYPVVNQYNQTVMITVCYPQFNNPRFETGFFLGVMFLTYYIVPLLLITVLYTFIGVKVWKRSVAGIRGSKAERNIQRSKVRIIRMLITVAIVFALLWLPLFSVRMRVYFGPQFHPQEKEIVQSMIMPIAQWLGSANSCVNPFIYCFFSEQFRKGIVSLLKSVSSCCVTRFTVTTDASTMTTALTTATAAVLTEKIT